MKPTVLTIVSGQPRSGTSLMMRCLELSGAPVICTERVSYELEATAKLCSANTWVYDLPHSGVLKVLFPQVMFLPPQTKDTRYKIIWLTRNYKQQARSQRKFLGATTDWQKARYPHIKFANKQTPRELRDSGAQVFTAHFEDLIKRSKQLKGALSAFLGFPFDDSAVRHRKSAAGKYALGELEIG